MDKDRRKYSSSSAYMFLILELIAFSILAYILISLYFIFLFVIVA